MSFFVVLYKQLLFNVLFCYIVGTNVGFFFSITYIFSQFLHHPVEGRQLP